MALIGDGRGGVFCANALERPADWSAPVADKIKLGQFSVVLTNPPFGKKIKVQGEGVLSQFDLAYKWRWDRKTDEWEKTDVLPKDRPPQLLFFERCLALLRPGGHMGVHPPGEHSG